MNVLQELRPGVVVEVLLAAGVAVTEGKAKFPIRCPLHDDRSPSAFVDVERNVFSCSACGSFSAKKLAAALNVPWPINGRTPCPPIPPVPRREAPPPTPTFTPDDARRTWELAVYHARDDGHADTGWSRSAMEYLASRGLAEAWDLGLYGVIAHGMPLPPVIKWWPRNGYSIVVPLYSVENGELVSVQARNSFDKNPKVMTPEGSKLSGSVFASPAAREILRGGREIKITACDFEKWGTVSHFLFGEGLTDSLALTLASPVPVLCAPGASVAQHAVDRWAAGRTVLVAMDADDAGEKAAPKVAEAVYRWGGKPRRLRWPDGCKDACDALARLGVESLSEMLREVTGRKEVARA